MNTLGEKAWECRGKIIGLRVLENGKMEMTGTVSGRMFDGDMFTSYFSYDLEMRGDGTTHGLIRGMFRTLSGASGTFTGEGNAVMGPDGSSKHRGCLCYSNPPGKYAAWNGVAVVYDYDVDKDQNISAAGWEWK